jgi:hypothetical protein
VGCKHADNYKDRVARAASGYRVGHGRRSAVSGVWGEAMTGQACAWRESGGGARACKRESGEGRRHLNI